ncbi:MAG: MiaB/RimO family radical SAM methylthiotransferase [Thermoanaerobaculia bacterium]|nr:MiaB/RimO family radical SAM methylthiotransferase [Thermoanaerobaculia bacterium]
MTAVSTNQTARFSARRIYSVPLGCKVSRIDAAALADSVEGGEAALAGPGDADVLLVHGCAVTDRAERDGRRLVRRLRRANPRATLVVSGCLAERAGGSLARMPEVDLVVSLAARGALPEILDAHAAGLLPGRIVTAADAARAALFAMPAAGRPLEALIDPDRTRAFLKIQDGCERRCAFCVVPSLRGKERSARIEDVVDAVRRLGDAGVPEVVLAGVHLAAFGHDRGTRLVDLLARLEADPPACRVRLSSLEPMEAGDELVDLVASSRVVVPHLHLPLQSGSLSVLKRMRRGIVPARYRALAERAARANPRLHLATDLIAGFPGETDADFAETCRFVEDLPFASLHVFPFSPRGGTDAAAWHLENPLASGVLTERTRALRRIGAAKARAFAARAAGTTAEIVTLRGNRGLTDHYLEVSLELPPEGRLPGRRLQTRLVSGAAGMPLEAHPC